MQEKRASESKLGWASRGFANAYALLILTMLFWAGNSVVARGSHDLVPPLTLAWLRWTLAFLLVLPFAWPQLKRDRAIIRAHWRILLLLGVIGAGSFVSVYYIGLGKTSAINGLIINSTLPILIPLATFAIYRERVSWVQALGIAVSFCGVLTVLARGDPALLASFKVNDGDLWVLAAMGIWAVYTALLREQPQMHWLSFAAITFAVASVFNLPLFLSEYVFSRQITPTLEAFLAIAYVATLPSVVAQIFFIRGVELIGGNRAGVFMHLIPLFGAVLAIMFLGEQLHPYHFIGFGLILAGVWVAASRQSPPVNIHSQ
jgi:drug/metabolite transporter (DMT)-like permease